MPSKPSYDKRLRLWKFRKNTMGEEKWKAVGYRVQKRKNQTGKESDVYIGGEKVPEAKLRATIGRYKELPSIIRKHCPQPTGE